MFIIESVNSFGVVMRQTIYNPRTFLPVLKSRGSLEIREHRHIRVMTQDGQTLGDVAAIAA